MTNESSHESTETPFDRLLGQVFRKRRIEAGLSLEELAERAGMSADEVHKVEQGDPDLLLPTAAQLARGLREKVSVVFAEAEALQRAERNR
jgi:transcriptional regulator with XRE-family HTH domain